MHTFSFILGEVTGKGRIPYSDMSRLGCIVTGLPDGIDFKQPKEYSSEELRKIHSSLDNIKFVITPFIELEVTV